VKRNFAGLVVIAGLVFVLDRWTKRWASVTLPFNQPVQVIGDWLRLTYTRNSGVAFGIGQGSGFPYYVFSLLAVAAILWLFLRRPQMGVGRTIALSLIFGGALGNLVDRINGGEVVDFIEIGVGRWHWPVFNIADMAVTTGVVLFALTWSKQETPAAAPGAPGTVDAGLEEIVDDGRAPAHGSAEPRGGETGPLSGRGAGGPLS
jgi:signal peptidase II